MPAAATAGRIRILDHKAGASEILDIIDRGMLDIRKADRIEQHLDRSAVDHLVVIPLFIKGKAVLETGTAAPLHVDAKMFPLRLFTGGGKALHLLNGFFGQTQRRAGTACRRGLNRFGICLSFHKTNYKEAS